MVTGSAESNEPRRSASPLTAMPLEARLTRIRGDFSELHIKATRGIFLHYSQGEIAIIGDVIEVGLEEGRTYEDMGKILDKDVPKRGPNMKNPKHTASNVASYAKKLGLTRNKKVRVRTSLPTSATPNE